MKLINRQYPLRGLKPGDVFQSLGGKSPACVMKMHQPAEKYHYSFIGVDPYVSFHSKNGINTLTVEGKTERIIGDPFELIEQIQREHVADTEGAFPAYFGGLLGFIAYDAARLLEKLPQRHPDNDRYPDFLFHAFRVMVCIDHVHDSLIIGVVGQEKDIEEIYATLKPFPRQGHGKGPLALEAEVDDAAFVEMVASGIQLIKDKRIKKIVLSRSFTCPFQGSLADLFEATCTLNPSPYHYLLSYPEFAIVGASPERLIRLRDGELEMTPTTGTIVEKSQAAEEELLTNTKEDQDHRIALDAAYHALTKVSQPETVRISSFKKIVRFPFATHLVSHVVGSISPTVVPLKALKAVFPASTLTGNPKHAAMVAIEELEHSRRGPFGGVVCTMDSRGNFNSAIIIRSAFIKDGKALLRAGAGIIEASDPLQEAHETHHKVQAMHKAITYLL